MGCSTGNIGSELLSFVAPGNEKGIISVDVLQERVYFLELYIVPLPGEDWRCSARCLVHRDLKTPCGG